MLSMKGLMWSLYWFFQSLSFAGFWCLSESSTAACVSRSDKDCKQAMKLGTGLCRLTNGSIMQLGLHFTQ